MSKKIQQKNWHIIYNYLQLQIILNTSQQDILHAMCLIRKQIFLNKIEKLMRLCNWWHVYHTLTTSRWETEVSVSAFITWSTRYSGLARTRSTVLVTISTQWTCHVACTWLASKSQAQAPFTNLQFNTDECILHFFAKT